MANLDSAWQSSVVQLAQQGNLKAITFWLNRYLVPQGMCAQVIPQQPGLLLVRVVCHRLPDGDRLVHFIRQRFFELNSELIQAIQITAQMLGANDLLWQQLVPVRVEAPQPVQPVAQPQPSQSQPSQPQPSQSQPSQSQPSQPQPSQPQPNQSQPSQPVTQPAQASYPDSSQLQFVSRPIPRAYPAKSRSPRKKKMPRYKLRAGSPIAKLRVQVYRWSDAAIDQMVELTAHSVRATRRSRRWFRSRPPEVRALLLGGSVVTAIAAVCGVQVLSQSLSNSGDEKGGLWGATLTAENPKPQVDHAGTVTAALEQVPVIRKAVANPADPTVTLVFGSNGVLAGSQSIAVYQQADLLMTNLDNALETPIGSATAPPIVTSEVSPSPAIKLTSTKLTTPTASLPSSDPDTSDTSNLSPTAATDSASMLVSSAGFLSSSPSEPVLDEDAEPTTPPASRKATAEELLAAGVDVVNVAADAVLTSGDLGQTLSALDQQGLYPVGAGKNQQSARRPQIFEVKGKKIALLGYSDSDAHSAGAQTAGMNAHSQVEADIKAIREQVDWVIVSYHWNKALRAYPEESQSNLARAAIDHGADLVVGYAPQMTQGAEIYQGRAIVYSLGDAIEELGNVGAANTAALKVMLHDKQMQLEFLPVQIQQNQPMIVEGDTATRITAYLQQASSLFDHPFRSPVTLDTHLRLSLPAAPDSELPTEPFLSTPPSETL
jgi:hypothetical protein